MKATVLFLAAAAVALPIQLGSISLSEPSSLAGDHKKKDKDKEEEEKEDTLLAGDHKKKDKDKEEEEKEDTILA